MGPDDPLPLAEISDDELERMLREMEDEFDDGEPALEDSGELGADEEDTEDTEELSDSELPKDAAIDYQRSRKAGAAEDEDPMGRFEQTMEQRVFSFATNATLVVQYQVQAAAGGGTFTGTEANGLLTGRNQYPIKVLDEFTFGADSHRNQDEILLNPNTSGFELVDIEGQDGCQLMFDSDGDIKVRKPVGLRLDVYRMVRQPDGSTRTTKIHSSETGNKERLVLPTDPVKRYTDFTEFMLGIGMTTEESLCYAFSVYAAVRLERPTVRSTEQLET